jgi:hypothetical protein
MATLAQIQTFALGNPELKQRFAAGRLQVSWNILAENAGVPTAPRKAWAVKVFENPLGADLDKEYHWFLSHANVQNGAAIPATVPGDTALVTAVASFVDAWGA